MNFQFHTYQYQLLQIGKKTAHIWEYKVGNDANIANFVCL